LSATLPATDDAAGWAAVTFTASENPQTVPPISSERDGVSVSNITIGETTEIGGMKKFNRITIEINAIWNDPFLAIAKTAYENQAVISYRQQLPKRLAASTTPDTAYVKVRVLKASVTEGGDGNAIDKSIIILTPQSAEFLVGEA
jgi:hypothetical protein